MALELPPPLDSAEALVSGVLTEEELDPAGPAVDTVVETTGELEREEELEELGDG